MTALPTITIVTPTFNAVGTIEETFASLDAQGVQFEHVVIDGGSSDGTVELLEARAAQGLLRFVSEPDDGLSDAFNKGLAMATGDIVGWLNADDLYEPGTLAAVQPAFGPDVEWLTGECRIIGADGAESRRAVTAYKNFLLHRWSPGLYLTNNFISSPATFVRRTVALELGGLDTRFKYSADYDLWLKFARRSKPVVLRQTLASFRMGEGSLSITGFENQFREHALNARENGDGHRLAVAVNAVLSRAIVLVYRAIRRWRRLRS